MEKDGAYVKLWCENFRKESILLWPFPSTFFPDYSSNQMCGLYTLSASKFFDFSVTQVNHNGHVQFKRGF